MAGSGAAFTRASGALAKVQSLSTSLASRISGSDGASRIASGDTAGGALWTTMAGFITALLGGQVTHSLPTRAQMVANPVPSAITTIATSGFSSSGDGGGATYVRATGPFNDGTSFQSLDGAWWQFQPNGRINAQAFGVLADGYSFANGSISAGALTKLVLGSTGWKPSAVAVGNAITVIGGAAGGGSLITTIAAISGNTITLAAPVHAAMANVCGNFGTDNTNAWAKIVAYALSLVNAASATSLIATDVRVHLPFGIMCFAGTLSVPDYVSLTGWGSRGTQFLAMASAAQMHLVNSGYNGASGAFGQNLVGFAVHGNNITTSATGLVHADVLCGATCTDFKVWWSLADGLCMDNAQNCQFNNCSFSSNGNPAASFYTFSVSGIAVTPAAGTVYTNNNQSFRVSSASITAGAGTIVCIGTGAPTASGALSNNNGGTGDASIAYSAFTGGGQTGAHVRFTNAASGNIFIRSEMSAGGNWGIVFEGGCGQNVILLGECEFYKGNFVNEYYPTAQLVDPRIFNILCDGSAGAEPYGYDSNICLGHQSNINGGHILLRGGGTHIIDSCAYGANSAGGQVATLAQFGPSASVGTNLLICQGSIYTGVDTTLFYDAHATQGKVAVQVLGQFTGGYTTYYNPGTTGQSAAIVVTTPVTATMRLNSGNIQFPATQIASTDANTLDDYREFYFSPVVAIGGSSTGVTYSSGPYCNGVKIGQKVSGTVTLTLSSIASLTGAITIGGFPIAANSNEPANGLITFTNLTGVALGSGNQLTGYMSGTTATIQLSGASGTSAAQQSVLSVPTAMTFSFEYLSQ